MLSTTKNLLNRFCEIKNKLKVNIMVNYPNTFYLRAVELGRKMQ